MAGSRGFTAVELLIAVAVAGALAALSVSSPSTIQTAKVQSYRIQLRDILQQARNLARARQECVTVQVNPQSVIVQSFKMAPPCAAPFASQDQVLTSAFDPAVTLVPFDAGNPLIFNTQGGLDYANPTQMSLKALGQASSYTILPLIGQIVGP